MATKIKKGYDKTAKERKDGRKPKTAEPKEKLEPRDRPIYPEAAVLAAPLWRRFLAYLIDVSLAFTTSSLMIYSASIPATPMSTRLLMLLSALVMQLWFFGFLPAEYTLGQTLGEKLLRLYVRQVGNKKALSVWRSMLRGYVYGVIGMPISIPFEIFALVIQYFTEKTGTPKRLQNLPISTKALTLPRDALFNVEVIYLPK